MFWPYHDTIFENQRGENLGAFSNGNLKNFAAEIGLDTEQFDDCFDDGRFSAEVRSDGLEAEERGVSSTPVFFINGEENRGALPFEDFQRLIEAELARLQ